MLMKRFLWVIVGIIAFGLAWHWQDLRALSRDIGMFTNCPNYGCGFGFGQLLITPAAAGELNCKHIVARYHQSQGNYDDYVQSFSRERQHAVIACLKADRPRYKHGVP